MYTHSLDSDSLENNKGILARVDLQLIAMIDDARQKLQEKGIHTHEKIFMHGFSASGNFSNRFAALHPQKVKAVASGGVNGMPILPIRERDGKELLYHVGVGDIHRIADIEFDLEEYRQVAQYIYMGEHDRNDTLPYGDAYNEDERSLTVEILGQTMRERWKNSQKIYDEMEIPAQFVTYAGIGHTVNNSMIQDIINFFSKNSDSTSTFIEPSTQVLGH
jgi:dienelactone hydrolase